MQLTETVLEFCSSHPVQLCSQVLRSELAITRPLEFLLLISMEKKELESRKGILDVSSDLRIWGFVILCCEGHSHSLK